MLPKNTERKLVGRSDSWGPPHLEPEVKEAFTTLTRLNTKTLPSAFEYLSSYKEQLPERQAILKAPIQERQLVYQKKTLQSPEQAFDRIAQCGPYLKGIAPELVECIRQGECKTLDGFPVRNKLSLFHRLNGHDESTAFGSSNTYIRDIQHSAPFPSLHETLHHIAQHGALPHVINVISHELTHLRQKDTAQCIARWATTISALASPVVGLYGWMQASGPALFGAATLYCVPEIVVRLFGFSPFKGALNEAHAGIMENSLYTVKDPHTAIAREHQRLHAVISEPEASTVDRSAQVIRALLLLTDDELLIAQTARSARYDPKTQTFPKLEAALTDARLNQGLEDDQVFASVMLALEARDTIERAVYQKEARAIALNYTEQYS